MTVVGVVGDSIRSNLQAGAQPSVYLPLTQFTLPFMGVMIRSELDEAAIAAAVRSALKPLDAEMPIGDIERVEEVITRATGQPRFRAVLFGGFAVAALVLAAVGLYGLISFTVAQRVPEIGVRLALGARPADIGRLVLGHGIRLAALGIVLGLAGAVAAARLLEGLLYSISATDPRVYAGLAVLLLAIAALASYMPARRAMRVDPVTALRAE
jgi:putative ABC transport system permease protein